MSNDHLSSNEKGYRTDPDMLDWVWRWIDRMASGQVTVGEGLSVLTYHPHAPPWVTKRSSEPLRCSGEMDGWPRCAFCGNRLERLGRQAYACVRSGCPDSPNKDRADMTPPSEKVFEPPKSRSVQRRMAALRDGPAPEFGPSQKVKEIRPVMMGHPECEKCGGLGWLRGRELDHPDDDTCADTMTKYACDGEKCRSLTGSEYANG